MAENIKKVKVRVKQPDGSYATLHPESQADITQYNNDNSTLKSTDVKEALDEIDEKIKSIPDTFVASINGITGKVRLESWDESVAIVPSGQVINLAVDPNHLDGLSYNKLLNKPSINNIELTGNVKTKDLHIKYTELDDAPDIETIKTDIAQLKNDVEDLDDVTILHSETIGHLTDDLLHMEERKQDKLIPGENITIVKDAQGRPVISATGGGGSGTVKSVNGKGPDSTGNVTIKTNDIENNSGFVTKLVDDLVNYYKKTETYTKDEVDALIAAIETLKVQVVDALPEVGSEGVLYLLRKQNYCEEYLWVDGKYEKIGETTIDLSAYRKAADQDVIDATKVNKQLTSADGKALIFNEEDGGGIKFEHTDNTWSFVGVNNGGANGIAAQIYAVDHTAAGYPGTKIDVTKNGIYYTKGDKSALPASQRDVANNELVVKEDLNAKQNKLIAGPNITIDENNVISATGGGSTSSAGIYGGVTFAPRAINIFGLCKDNEITDLQSVKTTGYTQYFYSYYAQHVVFAYPKSLGNLTAIHANEVPVSILSGFTLSTYTSKDGVEFNIYFQTSATSSDDLMKYEFKWN